MTLAIVAVIAGALFMVGVSGKAYLAGVDHEHIKVVEAEQKRAAAEAELQKAADAKKQADQDKLSAEQKGRDEGYRKAASIYEKVLAKGAQNVVTRTEFVSAPCTMDDGSLYLLNRARANVSVGSDPGELDRAVSGPGPTAGREVRDAVPTDPQGRPGPGENVRPTAPRSSAGDAVSGQVPGRVPAGYANVPKPVPK